MEKTRVPKGEKYWYVNENFDIDYDRESYSLCDDSRFDLGNYFHTEEEAESMARKLRAVLKGAEVIEMPSEEEFRQEAKKQKRNHIPIPDEEDYKKGFWDAVWVIKSKIVK